MGTSFSLRSTEEPEPPPKPPGTPGWVWALVVGIPLVLSAVVVAIAVWLTMGTTPAPAPRATTSVADLHPPVVAPLADPRPASRGCALAPPGGLVVSARDRARRPAVAVTADHLAVAFVRYTSAGDRCQRLEALQANLAVPLPAELPLESPVAAIDEGNGCTGIILHTPALAVLGGEPWAFTCRFPVTRGLTCQVRRNASQVGAWGLAQTRDTPGSTAVAAAAAGTRAWIAQPADARGIVLVVAAAGQRVLGPSFVVTSDGADGAALAASTEDSAWLAWRGGSSIGILRVGADGRAAGTARRVASLSSRPTEPSIAATDAGAVVVFGDAAVDGTGSVMVVQVPRDGEPTTPVALASAAPGTTMQRPRVASDGAGRLFVSWTERTGGAATLRAAVFRADDLSAVVPPFQLGTAGAEAGESDLAGGPVPLRAAIAWEERTADGWSVRVARLLCAE